MTMVGEVENNILICLFSFNFCWPSDGCSILIVKQTVQIVSSRYWPFESCHNSFGCSKSFNFIV